MSDRFVQPREHATDTNFSSGPSTGTPTKVDPGAAVGLQGFVPGITPFSPAQLNYMLNQLTASTRALNAAALRSFAGLLLDATPTASNLIAATWDPDNGVVYLSLGGTNGSFRVTDEGYADTSGNIAESPMALAKSSSSEWVVGVTGTNFAYRSTNDGSSWTVATTKPAKACQAMCFGDARYLGVATDNTIYTSPTGDVWTVRTPAAISPVSCCAIKSDGVTFSGSAGETLLIASSAAVEKSTDAGVTWAAAAAIPDAGSIIASSFRGWLAALPVGGTEVVPFFLAQIGNDVDQVWRLYRGTSTAGAWVAVSDLPVPDQFAAIGGDVRLIADPETGALYALVATDGGSSNPSGLWASFDYGVNWIGPALLHNSLTRWSVAAAGGRVFVSNADDAGVRMSALAAPFST